MRARIGVVSTSVVLITFSIVACGCLKWIAAAAGGGTSAAVVAHSLGFKSATPEELRGIPYAIAPPTGALPPAVDLCASMPAPRDQGEQPSCVGWAVGYGLKSYQEATERNAGAAPRHDRELFSPAYVYNQVRDGEGSAKLITALTLLRCQGAATLDQVPSSDRRDRYKDKITRTARQYRIDFWRRLNPGDLSEQTRRQLAAGFPVVIGADVDQAFMDADRTFVWKTSGASKGGHAMLVVAYDDAKGAFKVLNSWGANWGDHGWGWIAYALFPSVVREAYVTKDALDASRERPAALSKTGADPGVPRELRVTVRGTDAEGVINGDWSIPAGLGRNVQIVLYVAAPDNRLGPVIARFAGAPHQPDLYAYAAFVSPIYAVPQRGTAAGTWKVKIDPREIPARGASGTGRLVMFVDGFGIDLESPAVSLDLSGGRTAARIKRD